MDNRPFNKRASFAVTSLSAMLFSANLFLAEIDRPELLTRGFSNYYVVRALAYQPFWGIALIRPMLPTKNVPKLPKQI